MIEKVIRTVSRNAVRGLFIGFVIAMGASLFNHTQYLMPASPEWVGQFTTPLRATFVAALIWMGMGVIGGVGGLIFTELDGSITKKTILHFVWTFTGFTILAFNAGWGINDHGMGGVFIYIVIFILIYLFGWFKGMSNARKNVAQVNNQLNLN